MNRRLFAALALASLAAQAEPTPDDDKRPLNPRGAVCERYEFAELNTLSFDELEQLYCSYIAAHRRITQRADARDKSLHPRVQAALLDDALRDMEKCSAPLSQVSQLARKKAPEQKLDCTRYRMPPAK